jgi:hypothetical protein
VIGEEMTIGEDGILGDRCAIGDGADRAANGDGGGRAASGDGGGRAASGDGGGRAIGDALSASIFQVEMRESRFSRAQGPGALTLRLNFICPPPRRARIK